MAFNPDEYLAKEKNIVTADFNPDKYISENTAVSSSSFDPDAYLSTAKKEPTPSAVNVPTKPAPSFDFDFSKQFSVKDLSANDDLFSVIVDSQKIRRNKVYDPATDDKEDFVDEYLADQRFTDFNAAFGTVAELSYIKNADPADAATASLARKVYSNTASFYEEGGQGGISPYLDILKAIVTDPTTYLGFGVGKAATVGAARIASSAATTQAAKLGLKSVAKKSAAIGAVTEGLVGVASAATSQKLEQAVDTALGEEPSSMSFGLIGAVGAVTAALGGAAAYKAVSLDPSKYIGQLSKAIEEGSTKVAKTIAEPATKLETAMVDPLTENMDSVVESYMKVYGKSILEELDPAGVITDAKVKTDFVRLTAQAAFKIMETDTQFMRKDNESAMSAIGRIIANTDAIDGTIIESGLAQLGVTKEQYAAMFVSSTSEAGKILNSLSQTGKWMNQIRGVSPKFEKQFDALYSKDEEYTSALSKFSSFVTRIEREGKVWITSGIDTLSRNLIGTSVGLSVRSAVSMMEGIVYATGVGVRDAVAGKGQERAKKIVADSFSDAVDVWTKIATTEGRTLAAEAADDILKFNPTLRETLFSALQETGNEEISKIGRWANSLNVAVDGLFRRAVFTSSIEKQLRDQGMDLYGDFLGKNKVVPSAVIKRAVDDSLKATFSYMPKSRKGTDKSIEGVFESGASSIIRAIEQFPGSSLVIPFPRFMANAMAFQYRYSPLGVAGSFSRDNALIDAAEKAGDMAKSQLIRRERNTKMTQGFVGVGAVYAAIKYRETRQDQDWFTAEVTEGGTTDIRALFPLAPYFAVADFIVKLRNGDTAKTAEMLQTIIGIKLPAGSQNTFLDQLIVSFSSEKEADKVAVNVGKVLGDFGGRFTQPFVLKQLYDTIDMFSEDGTIVRDPNVLSEDGTWYELGAEAATKRVMNKLPILKEMLPEAAPRLKENDAIYREGEIFNRLIGVRQIPNKSPEEKEITKLGLSPYALYGASSGMKDFDNSLVRAANKEILPEMREILTDPDYQLLSTPEKRIVIGQAIRDIVKFAKSGLLDELADKDVVKYYKMQFNRLPSDSRKVINNRYKEINGVSLEEAGAYDELDDYKMILQDLKAGEL